MLAAQGRYIWNPRHCPVVAIKQDVSHLDAVPRIGVPCGVSPFLAHGRDLSADQIEEDNPLPLANVAHERITPVACGHLEEDALVVGTNGRKGDRRGLTFEFFFEPLAKSVFNVVDLTWRAQLSGLQVVHFKTTVLGWVPVAAVKRQ